MAAINVRDCRSKADGSALYCPIEFTSNEFEPMNIIMKERRSSVEPHTKTMKVLLVEDSSLLRETIMDILSDCRGLSFKGVALSQDEAIAQLYKQPFDLLLVDIELAQGNGFEVIKATQRPDYPFPRPTYLILTNHTYPQYRQMANELGVDHFFDKSMDFDLAIETIEAQAARFAP
ncbi:response regulator receiver domain protein (CheY-like) [Methylobacillus flagellatus KT]|uniref:Response regulator receiver domain protein (CheY-like) n=4 Tax=root TaxID=1 RepID=Q1H2D1_METFK|nr:response regulator receiver domain protein (CheY-like) [Methylobacillus flagellatus KT]ABE49356.1 response regulator receiver domain protein (CheY-like) [Methylobacillus flagellatus KT]ABZ07192.1 putative Response regulator receiver domain protein [uncultured marine microorganism HF4000_ANIW133B20]ABZ07594.1 putative Response regulator receiver domain protein [uncultured marine microorganism HF4000_ANIW137K11]